MRNIIWLFIIVCALAGICIFAGSVLGNAFGKTGLFAGAVVGGIIGVAIAVWLAARFRIIERSSYGTTLAGGEVGFALAAIIATRNLEGPIIPVASVMLIGLGAVVGSKYKTGGKV